MRVPHGVAIALGVAALSLEVEARAQSREAHDMLPPSPFDSQSPERLTAPPPPPWDEPLSMSGTDVVVPTPQAVVAPQSSARLRDLERRIAELERQRGTESHVPQWVEWLHPSLLLQPQVIWNFYNAAASPNAQNGVLPPGVGSNDVTATSSGNTTNPDFFRLRRARLKLDFVPSDYARFVFEIEPIPKDPTIPGSGTIARQIEALTHLPISRQVAVEFGGGSFEVPFGGEWREAHGDRPFIERSYFQQNVFPGDFDLGFHATLDAGRHVALEIATVNGQTFGELDHGGNLDLNRAKDAVSTLRFTFRGVELGLSGYAGVGQLVDAANLTFKQYTRLALDTDVYVSHPTRFGMTRVFAELFFGSNMDRGVLAPGNLPVIPLDLTQDVSDRNELGGLVRIDQDLGRYFTLGARYDYYNADVSLDNDARHTISGVLALRLIPEMQTHALGFYDLNPRVQVMLEYDHAIDTIRASGPQPDTKEIDTLSFVLQGRL
jgi:hypothetical protein